FPSPFASFIATSSYFQSQSLSLSSAAFRVTIDAAGTPASFEGSVNQAPTVVTGAPLSAGSEGFSSSETFAAAYVFTSASAWRPPDVSFAVPSETPEGAGVVSARGFACTLTGWAGGSPGFTVAAVAERVPASDAWASFSSTRRPAPGAGSEPRIAL